MCTPGKVTLKTREFRRLLVIPILSPPVGSTSFLIRVYGLDNRTFTLISSWSTLLFMMLLSVAENRAHHAPRAKSSDKRPFGVSKRCRGENYSVGLQASKLLSVDVKKIGCWNVRSMIDRETSDCPERRSALIATELLCLGIDIATLSETRLAGQGSFDEIIESDGYRSKFLQTTNSFF